MRGADICACCVNSFHAGPREGSTSCLPCGGLGSVECLCCSGAAAIMFPLCCVVAPEGQRGQGLYRKCG